jgi:type I restriction enzyme S subunit
VSWATVKLGELCTVVRGSSPRPKGDPKFYGGNVPRLMVSDVTRDGKYVTPKIDFLTEEGAKKSRPMNKGDFIIAVSGQPGQALILAVDACIHDGFAGLRKLDESKISKDYLFHFMNSTKEKFSATAAGAIFKNLTTEQIRELEIPLPPLNEQKRIASLLDKADAIRRKRQQAIQLADDFLRSVFLDMFGDPVTNPKAWEIKPLSSLVSKLGDGLHGTPNYDSEGQYCFINGNNLIDGCIVTNENTKKVNEEEFQKHKKDLNSNTMLVSINGTIGKVGFYRGENIVLGKSACYFNLIPGAISASYLYYLVQSHYFIHYVNSVVTGSTIKNVSLKSMRELPVPIPSKELQIRFEEIVSKLEKLKMNLAQTKELVSDSFNSLSQKSFADEL